MNATLDAALAWLLWTSVWWGVLALAMTLWFRWRPPQTAAVRHAALSAAILAGMLTALLPRWGSGVVTVTVPPVAAPNATPQPVEMAVVGDILPGPEFDPSLAASAKSIEPSTSGVTQRVSQGKVVPGQRHWYTFGKPAIAAAWILGALLLGVRLLLAARMTLRWRREARSLPDGELAVFTALRQELRVGRKTAVGMHEEPESPLLLCGFPPLVLVPSDWPNWDKNSRCAAWRHELAHVRRRDDWWRMLSETLRMVWWFHPGVRWLLSCREHEAELLSDEAAVSEVCPPHELAQVLLDACRRPQTAAWPAAAGMFFSTRTMKFRIARLLEASSAEALCRPAPRGLRLAACAGMTLLALAGSMRWIAAANETNAAPPVEDTASATTETTVVAPVPVADEPAKPVDSPPQEAPPIVEKLNYVRIVGQLLDADTGQSIEKASWEWGMADLETPTKIAWGHTKKGGGIHPEGKFEELVHFTPDGRFDRLRVNAAGYETTMVVDELPNPRPRQVERIVRLKRGQTVTGTLRDHTGKPVANGWVFFIPAGHRSNIVEGVPGTDAHELPSQPRDGAVAEARTNTEGQFVLSAGRAGTLAASTDVVDLWPFPLPDDGHAELTMPEPAHLVIDLSYWYLDELVKKGKRAMSPDSEDPNQCWIQVDRPGELKGLWKGLEYRRQMFVFAHDPRVKLSKGVSVGQLIEGEWDQPIPDVGHNKSMTTKLRLALPPGNYRVQRLRAGPFAPVEERNVELKPGEETTMQWVRSDGAAVRGKVAWPANAMFLRQPGEAPRKLDWSVPDMATVTIANAEGKVIEAARIEANGSFFVATHLEPGKYKATATVHLPEGDFRGGLRIPDCVTTEEFVISEPLRRPTGSPPVNVELALPVGGRCVPAEASPVESPK